MIGAAESISLIADGNLISSPCFQKYLSSGNVTILESTNQTLQKQQIDAVQVQFGSNPYAYASTPIDPNSTVAASEAFEPDVLGVSSPSSFFFLFSYLFFFFSVLLGSHTMLPFTILKELQMALHKT